MLRTRLALAVFFYTSVAVAQPFKEVPDAALDASVPDATVPAPAWPRAPEPSATTSSSSAPRPDPGPGLRERGGRRGTANPAGGVLLVLLLVGAIGWYVMKKIRKY